MMNMCVCSVIRECWKVLTFYLKKVCWSTVWEKFTYLPSNLTVNLVDRLKWLQKEVIGLFLDTAIVVAFVEDNATMSSIQYFENHASYFVQDRRKWTLLNSFLYDK